jgi:hypothetical protein
MAHVSLPPPPGSGGRIPQSLFGITGGLLVLVALFALYLVSPFFTVGEYERTVVTRFGQFSSVAGSGLQISAFRSSTGSRRSRLASSACKRII